ncbi:MAG: hypothetical protein RLZZ214_2467 [Verrucomicrobiota bacterium]|jgi:hypothetical protein
MKPLSLMLLVLIACRTLGHGGTNYAELSQKRIAAIERMLPSSPSGFGRPITDRDFWSLPATLARTNEVALRAGPLLTQSFPAWSDELYLDYSKTGRRPPGEAMIRARSAWLEPLVTAECLEDKGRFLPLLHQILAAYVAEPAWTLPAHDWGMENFHQQKSTVDLRAAALAADLAQTLYLLDDRIPADLRARVVDALNQRIFAPVKRSLQSGEGHWWLGDKAKPVANNWNSVCLAGVVGAARTVLPDRHERAVFLAAGEHYSQYFINGFTDDGYCEEGPGYWLYGFGCFVALREITADATGGRIDLFDRPKTRLMALFGSRIAFPAGDVPPFADCRAATKMNPELVGYGNRVFGIAPRAAGAAPASGLKSLAWQFLTETPARIKPESLPPDSGLRSYFDEVGVLVCRPGDRSTSRMSAAIKAGGNGSHSHNDIGSFVISLDGSQPVGDPGGPHAYDNRTFGPNRYERQILNSFGHPVPVVDGQLQIDAATIKPKVIETHFSYDEDRISIDLTSAYDVPALEKLTRTMTYTRAGGGNLRIEDHVIFSKPSAFEIALSTRWKIQQTGPNTLEFTESGKKLLAEVTTPAGFELSQTEVEELGAPPFTRIGLKLRDPVKEATVEVTFSTVGK